MKIGATQREARAFALALLVTLPFAIYHGLSGSGHLDGLPNLPSVAERRFIDWEYRTRPRVRTPERVSPQLVFIELDDDTATLLQREYASGWHFYADLLHHLTAAKPRVVFFDILLLWQSRVQSYGEDVDAMRADLKSQGKLTAEEEAKLASIHTKLNVESVLSEALATVPVVLPITCRNRSTPEALQGEAKDRELAALLRADAFTPPKGATTGFAHASFDYPNENFARSAVELAQTCETYASDGVLRQDISVIQTERDGKVYMLPSVPVVMARWALGLPKEAVTVDADGVVIGDRHIPTDERGLTWIGYTGPTKDFRNRGRQGQPSVYSARDIVAGMVPPERLRDKVIFFGTVHTGASDVKATPFSGLSGARMPGVETVATQVDALISDRPILHRPRALARWGFLITVVIGVLAATLGATLPMRRVLLLLIAEVPLVLGGAFALFVWKGLIVDAAWPTLTGFAAIFAAGILRSREDQKERAFLEQAFGKYLSPEMVKSLVAGGEDQLRLQGKPAELTILFADLRGFTSKSEEMSSEEMVKLLNEHLTAMSEVILRHGGTLDKFIGDCVMAFWGAPVADPEHALHACEAALDMLETLASENAKRANEGRMRLDIGVGLCTGTVTVGNMGSIHRFDYTVIGDAVNTASRLEGLTKDAGYGCLVGENTRTSVGERIPIDALGTMKVKGKAAPVPIFGLRATKRPEAAGAKAAAEG